MRFHYKNALLPNDEKVLTDINNAATRLYDKLTQLNADLLDISIYNRHYFGIHLKTLRNSLQKYSYILSWSVAYSQVPYEEFVFIDYGGGSGMLSLLAKELGVGTVIYSDIYEPSCKDAQVIGKSVQAEANYYVHGDIDVVIDFLKANSISCDAIGSYDVIEHIYDIDTFLSKVSNMSDAPFSVVLASGSNSHNPRIRRKLMQFHRRTEYKGRERKNGYKESYCTEAYVNVRKKIISDYAPSLSNPETERLVTATRGLIEPEIKEIVDEYIETGEISREPDHPTNTCNPFDGNWAERLMDTGHLSEILSNEGFGVEVFGGYYGSSSKFIKGTIGFLLNCLIFMLKKKGLFFAPFYTIYARKTKS